MGLVTYEGMLPDLSPLSDLLTLDVVQRTYRTEEEARLCVQELARLGWRWWFGSGAAVDCADDLGLMGVFLYSVDACAKPWTMPRSGARLTRLNGPSAKD